MSKAKRLVMYHGERVDMMGRISQVFKDRSGHAYTYAGIKNVRFGCVVHLLSGDKMKVRPESVEPSPWEPTDQEVTEYEANKIAVLDTRARRLKDLKLHKPNRRIVEAVDLLRPFYLSMHNFDRERFMRWVAQECSKKKGRRK